MAGDAPGTDHGEPVRPGVPPAPLALYRKYRPGTFAEVKGQEHVTEPLRQALRSGRVHHAYLFSGPRGCGKTSSARILARSLNCEQGPTPDPCGACDSCMALAPSGPGSIDVIEIDAASHGGVDDARDLRERAFYAPVSGRFKIYVIDEAHMVTREGFNALLKLVEEPPPHLKFVFATTEPEKVIPTIRSRTHHYPFRLVPPAVLRELLEEILASEGVACESAVLPLVVRAGAGSVRDSLSVLDQLLAGAPDEGLTYERAAALLGYTDDSLLDDVTSAFAAGDGAAVFGTLDRVMEAGHDPRRFATDLLDRFRDLIILAAVPGAGQSGVLDVPADRLERMAEQSGKFGQAELARAADLLSQGLIQMRGATSPRLLLELTCAQILLPGAHTDENALLARLERLERGLGGAEPPARPAAVPPGTSGDGPPSRPAPPPVGTGTAPSTQPAPESPSPAAAAPSGTGMLRERWADVLAAVKAERRVAWMLLNSAAVESLDEDVLTIAFAREGEARGFTSSGHDQVVERVLSTFLGRKARVKAVVNPGAAAQAGTAAPAVAAGTPARAGSGSARLERGPARPGPQSGLDSAGGAGPAPRSASRAGAADHGSSERPTRTAGAGQTSPGQVGSAPAENEWPEDAGEPAGPADSLTGVELIRHQLGGEVIQETEDG